VLETWVRSSQKKKKKGKIFDSTDADDTHAAFVSLILLDEITPRRVVCYVRSDAVPAFPQAERKRWSLQYLDWRKEARDRFVELLKETR
jgi:hypothetical protein